MGKEVVVMKFQGVSMPAGAVGKAQKPQGTMVG